MAAINAIWQIFIQPKVTQHNNNSLWTFVGILHLRETGKITANPRFQQIYKIIGHMGMVLQLDCWRVEAYKQRQKLAFLEDFAWLRPSFRDLQQMSYRIASKYVAGESTDIFELHTNLVVDCDQQHKNVLLLH